MCCFKVTDKFLLYLKEHRTLTPIYRKFTSHYSGIQVTYKMRNISKSLLWIFSKLSGFLALTILARHAKNQGRSQMKIIS